MKHALLALVVMLPVTRSVAAEGPVAPPAGAARDTIAIMDFSASNVPAGDAVIVSGFVRSAFVRSGKYTVVEKNNMDKVLAEQAFQQTGCTTSECAVKMGKLLNARKMVIGEFSLLGGVRFLAASLVDVETGAIERTGRVKGFEVATADEAADRLVAQLTGAGIAPGSEAMGARPPKLRWYAGPYISAFYGFVTHKDFVGRIWSGPGYNVAVLPANGDGGKVDSDNMGGGVRGYPFPWLMVEAYYTTAGRLRINYDLNNGTNLDATNGPMNSFQTEASMASFGGSIAYVFRPHPRIQLLAGGGARSIEATFTYGSKEWKFSNMTYFEMKLQEEPDSVLQPYLLAGVQWMTPASLGLALWVRYATGNTWKVTGHMEGRNAGGGTLENTDLVLLESDSGGLYLGFSFAYYF